MSFIEFLAQLTPLQVMMQHFSLTSGCFIAISIEDNSCTRYLKNTMMEIHQIWYNHWFGLKDVAIKIWSPRVKGEGHHGLTKHISFGSNLTYGRKIPGQNGRVLFKFGTKVHLDTRLKWLEFGVQRSRSLWPLAISQLVNAKSQEKSGTNIHLDCLCLLGFIST